MFLPYRPALPGTHWRFRAIVRCEKSWSKNSTIRLDTLREHNIYSIGVFPHRPFYQVVSFLTTLIWWVTSRLWPLCTLWSVTFHLSLRLYYLSIWSDSYTHSFPINTSPIFTPLYNNTGLNLKINPKAWIVLVKCCKYTLIPPAQNHFIHIIAIRPKD